MKKASVALVRQTHEAFSELVVAVFFTDLRVGTDRARVEGFVFPPQKNTRLSEG